MCKCHYSNKNSNLQDEETIESPWINCSQQSRSWSDPQRAQRHHRMNRPRVQSEEPLTLRGLRGVTGWADPGARAGSRLRDGYLCAHKTVNISETIEGFESILTWVYVHSGMILVYWLFLNEQVVTVLVLEKLD